MVVTVVVRAVAPGVRGGGGVCMMVAFVVVSDLNEFDTLNAKRDVYINTKARESPGPL
jgi:hypothetical protein